MGVLARGRFDTAAGVVHWLFTDRTSGASTGEYASANLGLHVGDDPEAVQRNRIAVSYAIGAPLVAMSQVHGRTVAEADSRAAEPAQADGIWTDQADLALLVQVADCVPILLADPASGRVAAVHAGWRGAAQDIVSAALEALAPDQPERLGAWIGPAICPGCYEVSAQVRDAVVAAAGAGAAQTTWGTPAVDVRAAVSAQLARAGVQAHLVGGCTFEDPQLFSYRRDGRTGRQGGLIVRRSA